MRKGQAVCVVETSKASIEVEAPGDGTLVQLVAADVEVELGSSVALVAQTDAELEEAVARLAKAPPPPAGDDGPRNVTRKAAERAAELGVDVNLIDKAGFVTAEDVEAFVTSPAHETRADGYIESALFGGRRPVANGTVNLFVNQADPGKKNMRYRLFFTAADGRALTLTGVKDIEGPSFTSLWAETTTLYTQILDGHVPAGQTGTVVASGVLVIRPEDFFFRQLFSFRTKGPSPAARLSALNRFGAMFFGKVWDVYGRQAGPA